MRGVLIFSFKSEEEQTFFITVRTCYRPKHEVYIYAKKFFPNMVVVDPNKSEKIIFSISAPL